jgi:hypothetical protein
MAGRQRCALPISAWGVVDLHIKQTQAMIKKLTGLTASVVALASTASAEVKINDYLSLDGYAIGSVLVTEGTAASNTTFLDSGNRLYDSQKVALNGTYEAFTGKVSLYNVPSNAGSTGSAGLLDAYITYTAGDFAVTAGKFNSWLGFESFDSPNNAFISYGLSGYTANYTTGAKVEYLTDTVSAGISVRDSLGADPTSFFSGDGEFSDDLGYEAYVLYTGIKDLTLFAGAGYEDTDGASDFETYNVWGSYAFTEKFSLAAEWASSTGGASCSWLLQGTYVINDSVSVAGRLTSSDSTGGDAFGYGVASTYTITENFAIKGEITLTDNNAGTGDVSTYAIQGLFKF